MKSEPTNIYESKDATFTQEAERLSSFELPNEVSINTIGELKPSTTFLDIGSGPSVAISKYVREHRGLYTAFDKNASFLELQKEAGATAVLGDIRNLPFNDDSFDITYARFVIAHLGSDKRRAIQQAVRVTKLQGRTIFIDFDWTVAHGSDTFNEFKSLMTSGKTLFDAGFGARLEEEVGLAVGSNSNNLVTKRYTSERMSDYQQVLKLREAVNADFGTQGKLAELTQWNSVLDKLQKEAESNNPPGFYFPDLVAVTVFKN